MSFIDEITTVRFAGRFRARDIAVVAEILEDPVRARLLVDGTERDRRNLPARFDLGDDASVEVAASGRTITDCAIVWEGQRTTLTLAPDSLTRRYLRFADGQLAARVAHGLLGWVVVPVLFLLGLSRLLNLAILERPLSVIGVSQPVDLPFGAAWWYVPLAIGLLVLLDADEKLRERYRRFLVATTEPVRAQPATSAPDPAPLAHAGPTAEWDARFDRWGSKVASFTQSRFTGQHAGHALSVVFDFFDEPTHVRLLVDGEDRGNRGVPARFDLGDGATLEADATSWAVLECAVVVGDQRTYLRPLDNHVESRLDQFWSTHPRLEPVVRVVGGVVILVAAVLGVIDFYNLAVGWGILDWLTSRVTLLQPINLPIGLAWWQALLVSVLPIAFEFDRDVRRSNKVFRPEANPPGPAGDAPDRMM